MTPASFADEANQQPPTGRDPDADPSLNIGVVVGLLAEARLIPPALGWRIAVAGGTTAHAAQRAAQNLIAGGVTALLSIGLAGGLDPGLQAGTLCTPMAVLDEIGNTHATDPGLAATLGPGHPAPILAALQPVGDPVAKRRAFLSTGCVAVDLESGAVARAATAAGLPFAVLRVICDPATRPLPPAALAALDSAGAIGVARITGSLLRRPHQLPALLALARDAATARSALRARLQTLS